MEVYCSNKEGGCIEKMAWSQLEKHLQSCVYRSVECPNEGCKVKCIQNLMSEHVTNNCSFAKDLCEICNTIVTKDEMRKGHKQSCGNKERACKMYPLGCTYKGKSTDVSSHEKDLIGHPNFVFKAVLTLQNTVSRLVSDMSLLKSENSELKLENSKLKEDNSMLRNQFTTKLQTLEKNQAGISEQLTNYDEILQSNFSEFSTKLTAATDLSMLHEGRISNIENGSSGLGCNNTERLREVEQSIQSCSIKLAENDLRFRCLECTSFDGTLIWKINNYRRRKSDAVEGRTLSLYSQPFYTSPFGYKMCARVYLNGDGMGRGTHISLFFVVMKGEYDALLPWPFRHRVSLSLMDQKTGQAHITDTFRPDPTSTSFGQPRSDMNVASGCPMFAAQAVAESDTYLQNDTLFLKVHVKTNE